MNRRGFLCFLGLAPIALPITAAAAQSQQGPLIYGRVLNVGTVPLEPRELIYSVCGGPLLSIDAVRAGGMELIIDGDDPDLASLRRASIEGGHVRTCLAKGAVRLRMPPYDHPVTVDACGIDLKPEFVVRSKLAGAAETSSAHWLAELNKHGLII